MVSIIREKMYFFNKQMKVYLVLAIFAAFTFFGATNAMAVVEIKWLQWWVNEWGPANHEKLIADFEKDHPNIKVKVIDVSWPQMAGKLQAAAAGGGETYDLIGTESSWISGLVKQGFMENLDPWLKKDPVFASNLTKTTPMKFLGKTRGLCLYLIPYHFAYNVDTFNEKGLKPPTNWDEFVQVLEKLRDKSAGKYGMSLTLGNAGFLMTRYFGFRLAQEGGQWLDKDGNVAFNSPQGVAALQWWKDLYDKGLVVPGSFGEDQSMMLEFVASGQVPTIIGTKAKQYDPNIKLAYAPAWRAKTGGYHWACSGVGIAANSPHKKEAWEFLRYLYSDDVSVNMTKKVSLVWATRAAVASLDVSDDPMLKQIPSFANQDPEHNVLWPALPENTTLRNAFAMSFNQALAGKMDPKTALDKAAAIWQRELDKVK
jgi:ABC-type glycerol-3-phosphate transport system substrate-binding protein